MSRIIILFLFVSVLSSCYNSETPATATVIETEPVTEVRPSERVTTDSIVIPNTAEQTREGKLVTYESCAVYAGATDYTFSDKDGKMILVRVNHFDDGKTSNPILPDNMLESAKDLEGPPRANPEMVGQSFKLIYDDKAEKVVKVILLGE